MIWLWAEMHLDICNGTLTPIIKIWPIHEKSRLEETFSKWVAEQKSLRSPGPEQWFLTAMHTPTGIMRTPTGIMHTPTGIMHTPTGIMHTPTGIMRTPTGIINKFQGDVSPRTLYNMEGLIIKFTNK